MSANYPAGITVLPGERGRTPRQAICSACHADLEYNRNNGLWYNTRTDQPIGDDLYEAPGGHQLCSQRCLSQHTYQKATESERELLRLMARICDAWLEETSAQDHIWCLRRSGIAHLVDATDLRMTDEQIKVLAKTIFGADYLNGNDDPPAWVIDMNTPKLAPKAETVAPVLEVAR